MAIALPLTKPLISEEKAVQERLSSQNDGDAQKSHYVLGDESKSCDNMKKYIFVVWYQSKDHRTRKLKNKSIRVQALMYRISSNKRKTTFPRQESHWVPQSNLRSRGENLKPRRWTKVRERSDGTRTSYVFCKCIMKIMTRRKIGHEKCLQGSLGFLGKKVISSSSEFLEPFFVSLPFHYL